MLLNIVFLKIIIVFTIIFSNLIIVFIVIDIKTKINSFFEYLYKNNTFSKLKFHFLLNSDSIFTLSFLLKESL